MRGLAARTVAGLAELVAALGVALFGPAWTFNFWQAWVYLLIFGGSASLITLYLWNKDPQLLQRRLNAGPAAEREKKQRVIQLVAGVAFVGLFVVCSLDNRFAWSSVPASLSIGADVLVALGFWVVFLVFRENTYTAAIIEVADGQSVVSTGPYALVRHPMYAGALLMLLATPLALGSWWGLAMFVPMLAAIVGRLVDEEEFLARNLAGYPAYRLRVRHRLLPLIW